MIINIHKTPQKDRVYKKIYRPVTLLYKLACKLDIHFKSYNGHAGSCMSSHRNARYSLIVSKGHKMLILQFKHLPSFNSNMQKGLQK